MTNLKKSNSLPKYLKIRLQEMPERPGVYFLKNRDNEIIYIGKALSLKKRIAGHFRFFGQGLSKETLMMSQVARIDILETPTEAEALLLEASLVKEQLPKYNQMLRDDKSYPFLKITAEEYPRLLVVRERKADGGKYFGPYTSASLLRQAVRWLRREFPMRTCKKLPAKICLMYHIGQCAGPCENRQTKNDYLTTVKELQFFLEGRRDAIVRSLAKRMKLFSRQHEYEKAQTHYELMKALSSVPSRLSSKMEPSQVLADFQKVFSLPSLPRRVECYDISNIQGQQPVGSMVVFQDGKPSRADYRRFHVKTVKGIDDYRMMREVVGRSYRRRLEEKKPLPDIVVIDGGKGHLMAAKAELDILGLAQLPIVSIAKEHEIIFSPHRQRPYVLSGSSPVLQLLRHLRDEAHRFAIGFHRRLHRKAALLSQLDCIHGLGAKGREKLLKNFGTVAKIKRIKSEELIQKAGLNRKVADAVVRALGEHSP